MKKIRIFSIMLAFLYACTGNGITFAKTDNSLVGCYVYFGTYKGEKVKYYIASEDEVGYTLVAAQIISFKAFDTQSPLWRDSTLRKWLNSDETSVSWNDKCPSEDFVTNYPYENENGFLTGMSNSEKSLLIEKEYKSLSQNKSDCDSGNQYHIWNNGGNTDYRMALQNYDTSYSIHTSDKVVVPSIDDLVKLNLPTNVLVSGSADTAQENPRKTTSQMLLRDACTLDTVRLFYEYNSVAYTTVNSGDAGVRPMLSIKKSADFCGNGTYEDPFCIMGTVCIEDYNVSSFNGQRRFSAVYKNMGTNDACPKLIAAVYDNEQLENIFSSEALIIPGRAKTVNIEIDETQLKDKTVRTFFWGGDNSIIPLSALNKKYAGISTLKNGIDFTILNPEIAISDTFKVANAFDNDIKTAFCLSSFDEVCTLQFKYPAKISAIKFTSVCNGDWATAANAEILVYNDQNIYRQKKKNCNGIKIAQIDLSDTSESQLFNIDADSCTNATHLQIRFNGKYMHSNSTWGGFREIEISGSENTADLQSKKTSDPMIYSNMYFLREMGFPDCAPDKTVSKNDACNAIHLIDNNYDCTSISDEPSASEFYCALVNILGYGSKYSIEDIGIGSVIGLEHFTINDMATALFEALTALVYEDNKTLAYRLYANGKINELIYDKLMNKEDIIQPLSNGEYHVPENADVDSNFSFTFPENAKEIKNTEFIYNMPFHYEGSWRGTLPEENTYSKRGEFAQKLKDAGAMGLRFPGGTPAHQYFIEGEQYSAEITREAKKYSGAFGGLYNPDDAANKYYIKFYDYLDFCKEYAFEPIFQVNSSFYIDNGKIRAIYKNGIIAKSESDYLEKYFDRSRIDEAAIQLKNNINDILQKGYTIKYWEIGNEDFASSNYYRTALDDTQNPAMSNYISLSIEFAKVIKDKIPDAKVIVSGGFPNMQQEYETRGAGELIDFISYHYPYGTWIIPGGSDKANLSMLTGLNEQNFVRNIGLCAESYLPNQKMQVCTTETSTWKFGAWDAYAVQNTFAMALNTVHNWGELSFETPVAISVLHDLESPYFGSVLYNVVRDPATKKYINASRKLNVPYEDVLENFKYTDRYFLNPGAMAFKLLSAHVGGNVLKPERTSAFRLVSAFASENNKEITVTVCNRLNESKNVSISLENMNLNNSVIGAVTMQGKMLAASAQGEYKIVNSSANIKDNIITFIAAPYSISQIRVK